MAIRLVTLIALYPGDSVPSWLYLATVTIADCESQPVLLRTPSSASRRRAGYGSAIGTLVVLQIGDIC